MILLLLLRSGIQRILEVYYQMTLSIKIVLSCSVTNVDDKIARKFSTSGEFSIITATWVDKYSITSHQEQNLLI